MVSIQTEFHGGAHAGRGFPLCQFVPQNSDTAAWVERHAPNTAMLLIQELLPLISWALQADFAGKNTRLRLVLMPAGGLVLRFDPLGGAIFTGNRAVRRMYQAGAAMFFAGATTGVVRCGAVFDSVLTSDSKAFANACARRHSPVRPTDPRTGSGTCWPWA